MKKNSVMKKFIIIELFLFVIIFFSVFLLNRKIYDKYEDNIEKNYAYILNSLAKDNKDIEEKIVKFILDNEYEEIDFDISVLEKNGLTKEDLSLSANRQELKKEMFNSTIIFLLVSVFILIIPFVVFFIIENRKIKNISSYLDEILNGNYHMDIRDFDEGNISHLKNDIYKVTVKLKEQHDLSIKDKKNLEETLSDISHQLKTPLTSMYVMNDLLENDLDPKVKREILSKNYSQLERIEWLVTSLLKISRLDSGTVVLNEKVVKVKEVINKAAEPLRIPIELKNIMLSIDCDDNISFSVDLNWTVEALVNIIKNAYEHTLENGKIDIKVIENPIYVEVSITDNGCGIKEKDINHIFERFYKGEENSESIGIGLNMARKIIDLEHGEIRVKSKVGYGTTFIIKFYKNSI